MLIFALNSNNRSSDVTNFNVNQLAINANLILYAN